MSSQHSKLQEGTYFRILGRLQGNTDISYRELAKVSVMCVWSMHYVLRKPVDKGFVKFGTFTGAKGKRRNAYIPRSTGVARKTSLNRAFPMRNIEEYEALNKENQSLQVGSDRSDAVPRI